MSMLSRGFSKLVLGLALLLAPPAMGINSYLGGGGPTYSPIQDVIAADESTHIGPYLSSVTTTSVEVSFIPDGAYEARVAYGTTQQLGSATTAVTVVDDTREDITLTSLTAGTQYWYQLQTRATGANHWDVQNFGRFRTLRSAGDTYSFGILTDSHAPLRWVTANCGDNTDDDWGDWELFETSIDNAGQRDLDFIIDLGDTVMTHGAGLPAATACLIDATDPATGTVDGATADGSGQRQAELRWQNLLMGGGDADDGYQKILQTLPFFFAWGNHDGGAPNWGSALGNARYYDGSGAVDDTYDASLAAWGSIWPNPTTTYDPLQPDPLTGGETNGLYYTWASGDARFYVLNPYIATNDTDNDGLPEEPTDWALGATQKTWFSTQCAAATEPWQIIVMHSLVGGVDYDVSTYSYARGGPKATTDGLITGTFTNTDQAWLQTTAEGCGVDAVLLGHDHYAALAEKLDSNGDGTGVHYVHAAASGGIGNHQFDFNNSALSYDHNGIIEATAGPATMACNAAADTFTCLTCDFVTAGFVAGGFLDAANFDGSADGVYDIGGVTATVITTHNNNGNAANLCTHAGDGDETLQMRLPDYAEDPARQGSDTPGFMLVTVNPRQLVFQHILSTTDATNNTVAFTYTINR